MKFTKMLAVLAMPVLFAASCGGVDNLFGNDGGTGACPAGTTLFKVSNGSYATTSVSAIVDTCNNPAVTAAMLTGNRNVTNDLTAGTIQINSIDGSTILGVGPVKCNAGSLTASAMLSNATCQYQTNRSSTFTLSADNTWSLAYSETRSQFTSVTAGSCTPPAGGSCTISYVLNAKM